MGTNSCVAFSEVALRANFLSLIARVHLATKEAPLSLTETPKR